MKRHLLQQLLTWKKDILRKPLILQGARQVGKTYLLKEFADSAFTNHIYINFEQDTRVKQIFEQDLDPLRIIKALELYTGGKIIPQDTLIIFDEIQSCPAALNSLKYFCENAARYYIVAAGSLLGVKLSNDKGFPVGKVNFLQLFPMTFFEFIEAIGKVGLIEYLNRLTAFMPVESIIHDELCNLLKLYTYIGGMPEAVKLYIQTSDLNKVRQVHKEIIQSYMLDFAKHAPANNQIMKIGGIWNSLPQQLARENKKFVFNILSSGARLREYEVALQWLIDAGLINISYNIKVPQLPLNAYLESTAFKIYCLDTGLLSTMCDLNSQIILEKTALFTHFNGALTENLVAQLLTSQGRRQLFYWTSGNTAEVDFIVADNTGQIQPLEVKSGTSNHKKSLIVYAAKYQPERLNRASLMNLRHDGQIYNYPLYLTEKFPLTFN